MMSKQNVMVYRSSLAVRAISSTEAEGIIAPFMIRDKLGTWSSKQTDFALSLFRERPLLYMHGYRKVSRHGTVIDDSLELVDEGLFAAMETDSVAHRAMSRGDQAFSIGSMSQMMEVLASGFIKRMPFVELSFGPLEMMLNQPGTTAAHIRSVWPGVDLADDLIMRGIVMTPELNDPALVPETPVVPVVDPPVIPPLPVAPPAPSGDIQQLVSLVQSIGQRLDVLEMPALRTLPPREEPPAVEPDAVPPVISVGSQYDDTDLLTMLVWDDLRTAVAHKDYKRTYTRSNEFIRAVIDKARVAHEADEAMGNASVLLARDLHSIPMRCILPETYNMMHLAVPHLRADEAMKTDFTNYGAEFMPQLLGNAAYFFFRMKARIWSLFESFKMPSNPFDWPTYTSGPTVRRVLELTDQDQLDFSKSPIPASKMGTDDITFTAGKIGALTVASEEVFLSPATRMAQEFTRLYIDAFAAAADNVLLNGDEVITTLNISHLGIDPTDTVYDRILISDGLRKMAFAGSSRTAATATLAIGTPAVLRRLMGSRGIIGLDITRLAMIVDPGSAYKFSDLTEYHSLADVGPEATLLTGQVGQVKGVPMIPSDEFEYTDSAGKYPSAHNGTLGGQVVVHRDLVKIGVYRDQLVESEVVRHSDGWVMSGRIMFDLKEMQAGATAVGYNSTIT